MKREEMNNKQLPKTRKSRLSTIGCIIAALSSQTALAVTDIQTYDFTSSNVDGSNTWTHTVDHLGASTGSITFNDWGYTGPMAASVNTFEIAGGFDASRVGQIQGVTTVAPDFLTSDPNMDIRTKNLGLSPLLANANMDGQVNFNKTAYTTPTSTFDNMQIDQAGNYFVAKDDMNFGFYDTLTYNNEVEIVDIDTDINFQPYAISDGLGWCGSTMVTNPNGVESMAGQITFDFAFDAYLFDGVPGGANGPQLVPGFVMRSYGDYTIDVTHTSTGTLNQYQGSAVGNNMNPESIVAGTGGTLDADFLNKVSFLGGGVVPQFVWVTADSYNADGTRVLNPDLTWNVTIVPEGTPGAVRHSNDFAGYAFLLRADAERTLEWINPEGHSDYVSTDAAAYASISAVPVPAAVWLFGSGLVAMFGFTRRNKKQ